MEIYKEQSFNTIEAQAKIAALKWLETTHYAEVAHLCHWRKELFCLIQDRVHSDDSALSKVSKIFETDNDSFMYFLFEYFDEYFEENFEHGLNNENADCFFKAWFEIINNFSSEYLNCQESHLIKLKSNFIDSI